MSIEARVDTSKLDKALTRLSVASKKDLAVIYKQAARRIQVDLAIQSVPYGRQKGTDYRAIQGQIDRDNRRVYNTSAMFSKTMEENERKQFSYLETNKPAEAQKFVRARGKTLVRSTRRAQINPARTGRKRSVPEGFAAKHVLQKDSNNIAQRQAYARVGLGKHVYALLARQLGGTRGLNAAWIAKARGANKYARVTITRGGLDITAENRLPYASKVTSKSVQMSVIKRQERIAIDMANRAFKGAFR
jgi:hypothetical protein